MFDKETVDEYTTRVNRRLAFEMFAIMTDENREQIVNNTAYMPPSIMYMFLEELFNLLDHVGDYSAEHFELLYRAFSERLAVDSLKVAPGEKPITFGRSLIKIFTEEAFIYLFLLYKKEVDDNETKILTPDEVRRGKGRRRRRK